MLFLSPLTKYWSLFKKRRKAPRSPTKPYTKGGVRYLIINTCKDSDTTYLKEKRKKNNERFPQNKSPRICSVLYQKRKTLLSIYVGFAFLFFIYLKQAKSIFSPQKKKKKKQPKHAQPPFFTFFFYFRSRPWLYQQPN